MAPQIPEYGSHGVAESPDPRPDINLKCLDGTTAPSGQFKNLILDIGGVLLQSNFDVNYGTSVPPHQFKRMVRSHTWCQYQMGKLSSEEVFQQLAVETGLAAQDIRSFALKARESLVPLSKMINMVEQLSKDSKVRLFGMTNCPVEDFQFLEGKFPELLTKFEKTFTSGAVGMRKPNADYFRHVIRETGIRPSETLFVDDSLNNLITAEVLGFATILAEPEAIDETIRLLVFNLRTEDERLTAARDYLERTRGLQKSRTLTSDGLRVPVLFDHFIIAETLQKEEFLPLTSVPASGTVNFFESGERKLTQDASKNSFTHMNFPDDMDTTSVALSTLYNFSKVDLSTINTALDRMERCVNDDNILQVYFDPLRPRVDHVTAANVLYVFHLAGRTSGTKNTEDYIFDVLSKRAHLRGSPYYPAPEAFLYHLSQLVCAFKPHFEKAGFTQLLTKRLEERIGMEGDALVLAMRILAYAKCGLPMASLWRERENLAQMQNADGSWDVCPYYRYNDPKSWLGNESLTTAFALTALECWKNQ